jgi:hypothetical protein
VQVDVSSPIDLDLTLRIGLKAKYARLTAFCFSWVSPPAGRGRVCRKTSTSLIPSVHERPGTNDKEGGNEYSVRTQQESPHRVVLPEPTDTAKRSTQTYVSYKSRTCLSDSVSDSGALEKETHQRQKPKQRWRPSGGTRMS